MIKILIVDDHPIVGLGTKNMLEEANFEVTYLLEIEEVINEINKNIFDIYLLDINMPNCSGIQLSKQILAIQANAKIILYTGFEYISQFNILIELGICGIVNKSVSYEDLLFNIQAVIKGYTLIPQDLLKHFKIPGNVVQSRTPNKFLVEPNHTLSQKEIDILEGLVKGESNKEIADQLFMSIRTVEYNLTKIYKKLGVSSRSEAVAEALRNDHIHIQ